jgi:hypothetical protein
MTWSRTQRGDVPVGCLIGFAVAVIVALIAIKAIPVMINVGELDKEIKLLADKANRISYNDQRLLDGIVLKATELGLPVTAKAITVRRSATRIQITVVYDLSIDFPGYTYVWHKKHEEERPLF